MTGYLGTKTRRFLGTTFRRLDDTLSHISLATSARFCHESYQRHAVFAKHRGSETLTAETTLTKRLVSCGLVSSVLDLKSGESGEPNSNFGARTD